MRESVAGRGAWGWYLWKDSHLTPSHSTTPDVISSSAKYSVSMPSSSCFLNWIPDVVSSSMESWAYMSSLVEAQGSVSLASVPVGEGEGLREEEEQVKKEEEKEQASG